MQLAATGEIHFDKIEFFYDEDDNLCADVWFTPSKVIEFINLHFISANTGVSFEEIVDDKFPEVEFNYNFGEYNANTT